MRVVVYVHGLWFGGGESILLRRRLSRLLGAQCRVFSYPSVGATFDTNVAALDRYLRGIEADTLHLVAHSMGGLLLLRVFGDGECGAPLAQVLPPGRIVLTGSPVRGSRSARRLIQLPLGRRLLGRTGVEVLAGPPVERHWSGSRDLGIIAGDLGLGLGRLLGSMDGPSDGTVLVEETDLSGAADRVRLPVSHTGLVFSSEVARQTAAFFERGHFSQR